MDNKTVEVLSEFADTMILNAEKHGLVRLAVYNLVSASLEEMIQKRQASLQEQERKLRQSLTPQQPTGRSENEN